MAEGQLRDSRRRYRRGSHVAVKAGEGALHRWIAGPGHGGVRQWFGRVTAELERVFSTAVVTRQQPVTGPASPRTSRHVVLEVIPAVHDPEHARLIGVGMVGKDVRLIV